MVSGQVDAKEACDTELEPEQIQEDSLSNNILEKKETHLLQQKTYGNWRKMFSSSTNPSDSE